MSRTPDLPVHSKSEDVRPKPSRGAKRLRAMYAHLIEVYGPQQWWPAETAFEVIVGAYLTQNTAWRAVERSIHNLREHGILTIAGIREVPEEKLRELIRPSGYMIRKAAALKRFVSMLDTNFAGSLENLAAEPVELLRQRLLDLPGVGPETADAILLYALGKPAMVVDEYLRRIVTRHELLPEKANYGQIQALAESAFSADAPATLPQHYNEFHALVVTIGKSYCGRVAKCEACPLKKFLPSDGANHSLIPSKQ